MAGRGTFAVHEVEVDDEDDDGGRGIKCGDSLAAMTILFH